MNNLFIYLFQCSYVLLASRTHLLVYEWWLCYEQFLNWFQVISSYVKCIWLHNDLFSRSSLAYFHYDDCLYTDINKNTWKTSLSYLLNSNRSPNLRRVVLSRRRREPVMNGTTVNLWSWLSPKTWWKISTIMWRNMKGIWGKPPIRSKGSLIHGD